jgi:PAS domain S-box-containing protein
MNSQLMMHFIYNAAVLLSISFIYETNYGFSEKWKKILIPLNGLFIGIIGMIIMSISFMLEEGIIFDTRSILIGVTALYFGRNTALLSALVLVLYRLFIGGAATWTGILVICVSAVIGLLWRKQFSPRQDHFNWFNRLIFGLVLHVAMLLCMFTLPLNTALQVLRAITLPVMLIYPVATVLLCKLLEDQQMRHHAMDHSKEAEEKYRSLFQNRHAVMMILDPESGAIVDANPAAAHFYGWSVDTLKSMNIFHLNPMPQKEIEREMEKARNEDRNNFIFKHLTARGDTVDVEVYSGPIMIRGKKMLYSIVHDISDRIASDKALNESVSRFKLLVESAPDAIFIQTEGRFAYLNQATLKLLGVEKPESLIGKSVVDFVHPDYKACVQERIRLNNQMKLPVPPKEELYIKADGTPFFVEVTAVPITYNDKDGAIVFARDIHERKLVEIAKTEFESHIRQQQKLEAIGTLAGGVAHEINNPINGIMNYAQLILDELNPASIKAEYAREIIHESSRISEIVKNLLQFSRYEKQAHSYANLYDIIHHTLSLMKTIIKKDQIELQIVLEENLPDIKCRNQQIQQVIMNLLTNARDSLNEKYPGFHHDKIILLSCQQYSEADRRWIRIIVEDHGHGIRPDFRDKIFEPFFSTKPKEVGTGLGLSISYGIVKEHHGNLFFESEVGRHTRFILELPVDNGWDLVNKKE